jgi:hypothetical protein
MGARLAITRLPEMSRALIPDALAKAGILVRSLEILAFLK